MSVPMTVSAHAVAVVMTVTVIMIVIVIVLMIVSKVAATPMAVGRRLTLVVVVSATTA